MGIQIKKHEQTKVQGKVAVGTVTKEHKDGSVEQSKEEVAEIISDKPMANVGVSIGLTRNLGNYESIKFTVSLYLPCINTPEEVNQAYEEAKGWVDAKVEQIDKEVTESVGH